MQRNAYLKTYNRYLGLLRQLEAFMRSNQGYWRAMELCEELGIDYTTWRGLRRWAMEHHVLVPWFGYLPGEKNGHYYWRDLRPDDFGDLA
jgi:hypothetical protein